MKGTTLRRIGWAAALVLAGAGIAPAVLAQDASPAGDTTAQTTQPVQQDDGNEFPWGLLGLLGLGGLAGLRRRDEPRTVAVSGEGAKTYSQR